MTPRFETGQAAELLATAGPWPPCPHCGGPAVSHRTLNTTSFTDSVAQFTVIELECEQECWRSDPEGYLESVVASRTTPPMARP